MKTAAEWRSVVDRKEKNRLKARIAEHIDLSNGRFTDYEVARLHNLVESRDEYDGYSQTYHRSYKAFDSEDTYRVDESDTYTFHSDEEGIRIEQNFERNWDDGQCDTEHCSYSTARGILNLLDKLKI